jgi:hypothetical protein
MAFGMRGGTLTSSERAGEPSAPSSARAPSVHSIAAWAAP